MTRLVKRYFAGALFIKPAFDMITSVVSSQAEKAKEKEKTKQSINERLAAEAMNESNLLKADMAQVAGQYDRAGDSATMGVIRSSLKARPDLTYHTPDYTPASQATTPSAVASSGALSGFSSAISSFFKRKDEDEDDDEDEVVEAQGEEKPALKGNLGQVPMQAPVTSVDGSLAEVEEQKKKAAAVLGKLMTNNAVGAKNGCKLKSKFNPRLFKKRK